MSYRYCFIKCTLFVFILEELSVAVFCFCKWDVVTTWFLFCFRYESVPEVHARLFPCLVWLLSTAQIVDVLRTYPVGLLGIAIFYTYFTHSC